MNTELQLRLENIMSYVYNRRDEEQTCITPYVLLLLLLLLLVAKCTDVDRRHDTRSVCDTEPAFAHSCLTKHTQRASTTSSR